MSPFCDQLITRVGWNNAPSQMGCIGFPECLEVPELNNNLRIVPTQILQAWARGGWRRGTDALPFRSRSGNYKGLRMIVAASRSTPYPDTRLSTAFGLRREAADSLDSAPHH